MDVPRNRSRFGLRADRSAQTTVLRTALQAVRGPRTVFAFDLDSTLLDNRPRQARLVREFGELRGEARLAVCNAHHVTSWNARETMVHCGLPPEEADALYKDFRAYWAERFFTSAYCADDEAIPGAAAYLRRVQQAGGHILYVTGRHTGMEEGTVASFRRAGFPLPGGDVDLWMKPDVDQHDDAWKEACHARLQGMRGLVAAFDNEPTHVNAYKRAFPDACVVHLDRDHSERPVEVLPSVPSILDFVMEDGA